MINNALAIDTYHFKPEDELFIDANVWLYFFGPQKPIDSRVATYSQALKKILSAKSKIYIDVLIVSEYMNTYARIKKNIVAPKKKFKDFRKSPAFKPIASDIAADIKRIISLCSMIDSGFKELEINDLLNEYAFGDSDFNDQVITALCKKKRLKLVTDDADFKGKGIQVVTANKRLLC